MLQAFLNLTVKISPLSDRHSSYSKDLQETENLKGFLAPGVGWGEENIMFVLYEIHSFKNRRTPQKKKT